jgi:Fe-S cluster assembly protein SufB
MLPLEFARLAGYYLADGSASVANGHECLQFSFHIDDSESIEEVRRLTKELYDSAGSVTWIEEKNEARVLVYSKAAHAAMRQHVGTRSHAKALSADILGQDETFLANLVETYLRGDGCVRERNGGTWCRANTTSRAWACQLQAIMARLGRFATVRLVRPGGPGEILGREVVRRDLYEVQWTTGGQGTREVRDAGDYFLVPIKSRTVEHFDGPVYNLDVEEPDSYLASGFAVHNCTAPIYSKDSLHSAVVEIIVKPGAHVRYTTIQNWSNNVYNLVTKRAAAYEDARMEWIDANIGSKLTMKYPSVWLMGRGAQGEVLSVAYAADGQHQDAGAKMVHHASDTSSRIISKSISKGEGRTSYRGLVHIDGDARRCKSNVQCDALLLDEHSRSDTYPYMEIEAEDATIEHEATVSKIGDDKLFYLMSRGLTEDEAKTMIVRGFVSDIAKELPMEYAVELNRLIAIEMEGAIG